MVEQTVKTGPQMKLEEKNGTLRNVLHLVFLQHGLGGSCSDLEVVGDILKSHFCSQSVKVFNSPINNGMLVSTDGIDKGGVRLADYVEVVLRQHPTATHLSFVGHSMGGLYLRYAVGVLFERGVFTHVHPQNIITFATPHLGGTSPTDGFFTSLGLFSVQNFFGRSVKQLALCDEVEAAADAQQRPLLVVLSDPSTRYIKGLALFANRLLVGNASGDYRVPYRSACLTSENTAPYLFTAHPERSASPRLSISPQIKYVSTLPALPHESPSLEDIRTSVKFPLASEAARREKWNQMIMRQLASVPSLTFTRVGLELNDFFCHYTLVCIRRLIAGANLEVLANLLVSLAVWSGPKLRGMSSQHLYWITPYVSSESLPSLVGTEMNSPSSSPIPPSESSPNLSSTHPLPPPYEPRCEGASSPTLPQEEGERSPPSALPQRRSPFSTPLPYPLENAGRMKGAVRVN
eukprot:GCRY01000307.1.p1 GENE.GCRY01000307.1~~GCRY01000307.1.p1  ORF type:complete len:462 (+),score=98.76 GCRY01000307.1:273-1658(+)